MALQGYRAQLPQSVVQRMVRQQPGVGAAIAAGLEGLGQTAVKVTYANAETNDKIAESQARVAEIEQARARSAAVADGMGRLAQAQLDAEAKVDALKNATDPGAPGFAAKAEDVYRTGWNDFAATLPRDPQVQQQFAPMGQRWLLAGIGQARDWESQQRTTHQGTQFESWVDTQAASQLANPSADGLTAMIADGDAAIDLLDVPGSSKEKLRLLLREKAVGGNFDGLLQQGKADAVTAAIGTGAFDAALGGAEGKARWLDRAGAVKDAAARQAEAQANDVKRAAKDALDALKARVGSDDPPTQTEINQGIAAAKAAGVDAADLIEAAKLGADTVRGEIARTLSTRELESQTAALEAKRSAGKATPAEVNALGVLNKEMDARADKAGTAIGELWKGDATGKAAAVAQVAGLAPSERWRVADKVGGNLGVLASLNRSLVPTALRGQAIRADRPEAFMPPNAAGKGDVNLAREAFNRHLGPRLINELGGRYDQLLATTLDLWAGRRADEGAAGGWNEAAFDNVADMVFGAQQRPDGATAGGTGTVRGQRVLLPGGWTASEFDSWLAKVPFATATYSDGSAAKKADVLAHFRPVVDEVGDDGTVYYRMEDARGRPLLLKGGKGAPYRMIFSPSPGRAAHL